MGNVCLQPPLGEHDPADHPHRDSEDDYGDLDRNGNEHYGSADYRIGIYGAVETFNEEPSLLEDSSSMSAASPSMPTPSTYLPKSHTARLTMETRLSDPQRQQHHPIHRISPFTPFSSAANTIAQTIQRLQSASVGPLILPRTSSLTALVLDLPAVVQGVLRSLPLAHVQRLSRINKQWRELAASVLARQNFALTLSFDGGEREWSVLVFPFEEYLLDASSDEGARGPVKGYRQNLTGRDSAILLDSEDDEVPAEPESYLTTSAVKVTKYKPVTFNKESCLPATQPIRTEDISQICIAPVSRGAPRTFSMKAPALDLVSDEPYLEPLQLYDEPDPLSTPKTDVCCRGRLPRRDNVFSEALFGARCGLVLTPSGADVDYFVVVSEEEDGAGGAGLGGGDAPGWQTVAIRGPVLVSEGRWRELLKFQKELETAAGATAFRGSLQRAPFFGAKGGGNALDARELFAIIDTVAVRNYLSCTEDQKVFAFRAVLEALIDGGDAERGHHELNELVGRLDRISHRVDILCQVDVPGVQRHERLRSYFAEACRAWLSVRGGDLALRVSGYSGTLRNDEDVYEHLMTVLLPAFS